MEVSPEILYLEMHLYILPETLKNNLPGVK